MIPPPVTIRALSSAGRASALQAECQRFDPVSAHHRNSAAFVRKLLFCYILFFVVLADLYLDLLFVITLYVFRIYFFIHVTFYGLKSNQKAFAPAKNLTAPYQRSLPLAAPAELVCCANSDILGKCCKCLFILSLR